MPALSCIETIAVENRAFRNLSYHQTRLDYTRKTLWGYSDSLDLKQLIEVPDHVSNAMHKCRIVYDENIKAIKWELHQKRLINSIKKIYSDEVEYSFKFDQRPQLNVLFERRGLADEILIIKNGMVTDCFYYNVAFYDGSNWYTPDTNLLPGTQRALLLDQGILQSIPISENDLTKYSHIKLFNALADWANGPELSIDCIS